MAEILPFSRPAPAAFDPETAALLIAAYDKALILLSDSGQPETVREVVAKRIIALAADGERDPHRLCERALASFGLGE